MYKYGSSFNCTVGREDVGGGGEGWTTLDYVANDLDKLIARLLDDNNGQTIGTNAVQKYKIVTEHELIDESVNIGGTVVAVMVTDDDDQYVTCVIFNQPNSDPTIVD
jgi:hypothetical protein